MQRIFLVSQKSISRLKQRARRIKREKDIPHHEALEITAKAAGFDNWHQVAEAAEKCKLIEDAYLRGFLLGFDPSEVPDTEDDNSPLKWEPYAFYLLQDRLFKNYASQLDEEDPDERAISETLDPKDLKEYFSDDWSSMYFFRLKCPEQVVTIEQLLSLVSKHSFWPPYIVFFKGRLVDTYVQPALDVNGEVVGIRF
ncbi:hypothetical protein [Pseudomonas aeruginosa]|uniref:Uncharacterized protein n=1 Tax=Pseudomonas aeruginosa TaxID=287 RepID=A0A643EF90_PSEAI|nr:hypothetical protein [Pseudomonas aeruginosa]KAB0557252.1 hypothetical protein F7R07_23470 [Pseudomonas aeruginosa]HEK1826538.1 hypothetical protein [Pseudomonas aeruginosa]